MKRQLFVELLLVSVVGLLFGQHPDWDRTRSHEITDSRIQKSINQGSIYVDNFNLQYVTYHQQRVDGGVRDRDLYFSSRDYENNWSLPERIEEAGSRFTYPNIIVNPITEILEIYGVVDNRAYVLRRDEDNNWTRELIDTRDAVVETINVVVDGNGKVHIVGVTEDGDEGRIIYIHNLEDRWDYIIVDESLTHRSMHLARPVIKSTEEGRVVIGYLGRDRVRVLQNRAAGHDVWQEDELATPMQSDVSFDIDLRGEVIYAVVAGQDMWGSPWIQHHFYRHIDDAEWNGPERMFDHHSIDNPSMVVDGQHKVHVVGRVVSGNLHTGELMYVTNANEDGNWEIGNPFEDHRWSACLLTLDLADEFQLLKVRSDRVNGTEYEHEVVHRGTRWQYILPVPKGFAAQADTTSIRLYWNEIDILDQFPLPDFQGYNLYRRFNEDGEFDILNEETITDTSYVDAELDSGLYEYYVTALFADEQESEESDIVSAVIKSQLKKPVFDPPPGKYKNEVIVSIKSPADIGDIYYTTDGTTPDQSSYRYINELPVEETMSFKAIVVHPDYHTSEVADAKYEIVTTSVAKQPQIEKTEIIAAMPNPFNPQTAISFRIAEPSQVSLDVYNIRGQHIKNLTNENYDQGRHSIVWHGTDDNLAPQPSGIYYIRLITDQHSSTKGVVLLK